MVSTAFPCLICYNPAAGLDDDPGSVTIPEVGQEDLTVFTLRCFLQLDKQWFDKHWTEDKLNFAEIRLCNACRKGVEQAKVLYKELLEMARKFREKQKDAVDKIRASSDTASARRRSKRHHVGNKKNLTEVVRLVILEDEQEQFQGPLVIEDWGNSDVSCPGETLVKEEVEPVDSNLSDTEEVDMMMNLSTKPIETHDDSEGEADMEMEQERDSNTDSDSGDDDNAVDDEEWSGAEEMEGESHKEASSTYNPPPSKSRSPPKRKRIRIRVRRILMDNLGEEGVKGFKRLAFGRVQCPFCDVQGVNIGGIARHVSNAHPSDHIKYLVKNNNKLKKCRKKFSCCGKVFQQWITLYEHLGENHEAKPLYVCDSCPEEFSTEYLLRCHAFKVHNQENVTASGEEKPEVDIHQRQPGEPVESMRCQTCGKACKSIQSLRRHLTTMHGIRPKTKRWPTKRRFPCPDPNCDKTFCSKDNADAHFASFHAKQIRFHCDVCGKGFYIERRLLYHQRTKHGIGNTPVICELCGKSFSNRDYLYCHRYEVHGKGKKKYTPNRKQEPKPAPEICDLCGKTFVTRATLQTHQAMVHNINVKFRCHVCNQPFGNQIYLKIHLHSKHKIGERPPEMDKNQGNYKYQCQVTGCKLRFSKQDVFDKHMREVHGDSGTEMPFKCRFCGKGFSIKFKFERHEMIHTNKETRPFKCDICDKGFTNPHNLRYHELYTHKLEKRIYKRKLEPNANTGQSENENN